MESLKKFIDDNSFQDGAAIAFYTIFSLPGIAIISVLIASSFYFEHEDVKNELLKQVTLLMGESGASQIELILNASFFSGESLVVKILGTIVLIFSATTVLISLQESLNNIWHIRPKPKKKLLKFVLNRLLSLAFVASIGFIILVSLAFDTMIAVFKVSIIDYIGTLSTYVIQVINFIFAESIAFLIFASIYKILPAIKIEWKDVWVGALMTTIFFTIGKFLISYYLSTTNFKDAYGAAASLVAMLAWVYYSNLTLFLGAQFTYIHAKEKGRLIMPGKNAVELKEVEVKK